MLAIKLQYGTGVAFIDYGCVIAAFVYNGQPFVGVEKMNEDEGSEICPLGKYSTAARCREIVDDITKFYNHVHRDETMGKVSQDGYVYEMPEE